MMLEKFSQLKFSLYPSHFLSNFPQNTTPFPLSLIYKFRIDNFFIFANSLYHGHISVLYDRLKICQENNNRRGLWCLPVYIIVSFIRPIITNKLVLMGLQFMVHIILIYLFAYWWKLMHDSDPKIGSIAIKTSNTCVEMWPWSGWC